MLHGLNLEFQEEYKRLDRLCKNYLSSAEAVSEYIRQMESTPWSNRLYVFTWEDDYKQLKKDLFVNAKSAAPTLWQGCAFLYDGHINALR